VHLVGFYYEKEMFVRYITEEHEDVR